MKNRVTKAVNAVKGMTNQTDILTLFEYYSILSVAYCHILHNAAKKASFAFALIRSLTGLM